MQQLVNRFRPSQLSLLKVDGLAGVLTTAAIEQFQKDSLNMAMPDGLVSPMALVQCVDRQSTGRRARRVGREGRGAFKVKVLTIARTLLMNPDFLMSAMAFETGETFSPP